MKQLVLGMGEIGFAIHTILDTHGQEVHAYDPNKGQYSEPIEERNYDVLHICFPPSSNFIKIVEDYKKKFLRENGLIIIHSTVELGTCDHLNAVASPVRGIHPNLVPGIQTFVKYFGGKDAYKASKIFEACQIPTRCYTSARDVEACKLWDTTRFTWDIIINKIIYKWCQDNNINFEIVWKEWNETYNGGYVQLGKHKFVRPTFEYIPGKIGGHCCMPNIDLFQSDINEFIKKYNEGL